MKEDQLKLLEKRINNAIIFIETLKSREKRLIQEKEKLDIRISSFEKVLVEKDSKIEELKGSQEFLREKIEAILGKLESFATIDTEGQFDLKAFPEKEKSKSYVPDEEGGDVIIEDEIVDLKEENIKEEYAFEEKEEDIPGEGENTADTPEEKLPAITLKVDSQEKTVEDNELDRPYDENSENVEAEDAGPTDAGSGDENPPDEMSDDVEDVLEGIVNEDIFQEEKPAQDENVLQSETSVEESGVHENASGNAMEKQESRNEESLVVDTALEKNENLLFTAESQNSPENLFQNDRVDKISKIRENTGGSFNKRWIDNNPFIQT